VKSRERRLRRLLTIAAVLSALAAPVAHAREPVVVAVDPAALPPPDGHAWWTEEWPKRPEAADPLGERKARRDERPPALAIDNGVAPLLYRLWALPPLQHQLVRGNEVVVEMWVRPAETVRQAVTRVILRRDGRAFVQGRAGLACCEPEIDRFVAFDAELSGERAQAVRAAVQDPAWGQPRMVSVVEDGMTMDQLCVNGVAYDVSLVIENAARSLHRACSGEQIGSIAPILEATLSAALGHDPRFDAAFEHGADFSRDRANYEALLARGGALQARTR